MGKIFCCCDLGIIWLKEISFLQSSLSIFSSLNMEDLQNLKYKELQKLAKAAGIKANSPKAELVNALIAFNNESETEDDTEKKQEAPAPIPETLEEKLDVVVQNKMNETFEKETSVLNVTFDKEDEMNDSAQTQDQSAEE